MQPKTGSKKTELLLNGLRRQSDLPADMAFAFGAAPLDQRQLDAIGFIERQPIEISARKELAARPRGPEILDRFTQMDCQGRPRVLKASRTFVGSYCDVARRDTPYLRSARHVCRRRQA
jgi:hypothetical protein